MKRIEDELDFAEKRLTRIESDQPHPFGVFNQAEGENYYGYMDCEGNVIIPPKYTYINDFSEGLACVAEPGWDGHGYINTSGEVVIPPMEGVFMYRFFHDGLCLVQVGDKWGYIDKMGRMVIPPRFDRAHDFDHGVARVSIFDEYGYANWGYIDHTGNFIIPPKYSIEAWADSWCTKDGLLCLCNHGDTCYFDLAGNQIRPKIDYTFYRYLTRPEQEVCEQYIDLGNNADFIRKGIAFCHDNPSHGILLTGINPSGDGGANVFYTFRDAKDIPPSRYWEHKKKQIVGDNNRLIDNTAYLDLFPYFESSQERFRETLYPHIDFQVKALEITQRIVEEYIQPRLIIAANDMAAYYWGFRPESTWLGYDFIKVDNIPECLRNTKIQLYRINPDNGFRKASDRVGQDKYHTSNIKGAYFIPYAMYDDRHYSSCPGKVLTPKIVMNLLDWIDQQK